MEMVRSKIKNGDDGFAEYKEPTGEENHAREIKTTTTSEIPRPPQMHELRG